MKRVFALVLALLVVCLTACQTEPPTNVTETSAVLHARGNCNTSYHLYWWYEARDTDPNLNSGGATPWYQVGPKFRQDCTVNTSESDLSTVTANTLVPEHEYQYRVGYQQDGGGQAACGRDSNCAPKGAASEADLKYDEVNTPAHEDGQVGEDYDTSDPSASVSGTYACNYSTHMSPQVLISEFSVALTFVDCKDDMNLNVTCKSQMHVGPTVAYDSDYNNASDGNNVCVSAAQNPENTLNWTSVGSKHNWYVRLNNSHRRWTSSFRKTPHRGGCETYFNSSSQHILHCWAKYGNPDAYAGPS